MAKRTKKSIKVEEKRPLWKLIAKFLFDNTSALLVTLILIILAFFLKQVPFLNPIADTLCKFQALPIVCEEPNYLIYKSFDPNAVEKNLTEYKEKKEKDLKNLDLMTNFAEAERQKAIVYNRNSANNNVKDNEILMVRSFLDQQNVLAINKDFEPALISYALILARLGNLEDSIKYIEKAIKVNPSRSLTYQCKNEIYRLGGDVKKTVPLLEKVTNTTISDAECVI